MTLRPLHYRFGYALNVAVFGALYAGLFIFGPAHFTTTYKLALAAGGIAALLVILSLSGDVVGASRGRSFLGRPRLRGLAATIPWLALAVLLVTRGVWWAQRPAALRLFAVYTLANWSVAWLRVPLGVRGSQVFDAGPDSTAARILIAMALVLAFLGTDGLAFGVTRFGVVVSGLLLCAASALATAAVFARPATRSNVIASCLGVLLALAVVETGIRMLHLGDSVAEVDDVYYVRQFHHMTPPRSAFINRPKTLDEFPPALVETNSLGIRGPEIAPGKIDLLLVGDSIVEARQLPWEVTLGPRLQQALRARSATARVVAHGMRGWSPLLEWNWYLKVGRRLHPRIVMLFFFWNDLWPSGDEVHTFQAVMGPDGRPDHFEVIVEPDWVWYKHVRALRLAEEVLQRAGLGAVKRSFSMVAAQEQSPDLAAARAIARRIAGDSLLMPAEIETLLTQPESRLNAKLRATAEAMFWPGIRPLQLWTDAQRQAAAKTEIELKRFAEDVASDGGRLVIVYVPNAYQISPSECSVSRYIEGVGDVLLPPDSGVQEWLRDVAERDRIELLDPSDAMRAFDRAQLPGAPPLYLRADCHWSERGHQFMADYLGDWYLRSQGVAR